MICNSKKHSTTQYQNRSRLSQLDRYTKGLPTATITSTITKKQPILGPNSAITTFNSISPGNQGLKLAQQTKTYSHPSYQLVYCTSARYHQILLNWSLLFYNTTCNPEPPTMVATKKCPIVTPLSPMTLLPMWNHPINVTTHDKRPPSPSTLSPLLTPQSQKSSKTSLHTNCPTAWPTQAGPTQAWLILHGLPWISCQQPRDWNWMHMWDGPDALPVQPPSQHRIMPPSLVRSPYHPPPCNSPGYKQSHHPAWHIGLHPALGHG